MRIVREELHRWLGLVLGAGALGIGIATISHQALAQGNQPRRPEDRPGAGQPGFPPGEGEGGGFGGRFGGGGFGGPMRPGMGMMGMMGGGASMTANQNTVYVLRGNQLLAFDANSLKLKAQAELPMPHPPGGGGGFGGGGFGGERGRGERGGEGGGGRAF
jgi:hypothetical protein